MDRCQNYSFQEVDVGIAVSRYERRHQDSRCDNFKRDHAGAEKSISKNSVLVHTNQI